MKIIITKRANDFHACLSTDSKVWGCGASPSEAIGDLIRAFPEVFKITYCYK